MKFYYFAFVSVLYACAPAWYAPSDFTYSPIDTGDYDIVTYQCMSDTTSPVHLYIEGDGHSFDSNGLPTSNPTPKGTFMRDLAMRDVSPNVVYMARPCQFIMSQSCTASDWTSGRFSQRIIDSMSVAVNSVVGTRPVVLIGYSGGAMISGLIIEQNPKLNVKKWITIAGVLNHSEWTEYFGDVPLSDSKNLNALPRVSQLHYVAQHDKVVPTELSQRWTGGENMIVVPGATHSKFPKIEIEF